MADRARIRAFLEQANFRPMLYEIGWNQLKLAPFSLTLGERTFELLPVAERSGFQIFDVRAGDGAIPSAQWRWGLSNRLEGRAREHLLVFTNAARSEFLWQSPPRASLRHGVASHRAFARSLGSGIVALVAGLDLRPLGDSPSVTDVTVRVSQAFRDDRMGYYTDYYHRLAHAEAELGIVSQPVRKSIWHYEDTVASREFDEDDFSALTGALGAAYAAVLRPPVRLDTVYSPAHRDIRQFGDGFVRADLFIDSSGEPVEVSVAQNLLGQQVEDVLASLTSRERRVLQLRFGLEDGRDRTLEEVGREFGVTRERIRQIEAKALRKLRHPSRSRKLVDHLVADTASLPSPWPRFWLDMRADRRAVAPTLAERAFIEFESEEPPDEGWSKDELAARKEERRELLRKIRDEAPEAQRQEQEISVTLRGATGSIKLVNVRQFAVHEYFRVLEQHRPPPPRERLPHPSEPPPMSEALPGAPTLDASPPPAPRLARDDDFMIPPDRSDSPTLLDDDDFIIDDPHPDPSHAPTRQQPLDLPGSLPLFEQSAASPEPPEPSRVGQLLFKDLTPEGPATGGPMSPKESLQRAVAIFESEGFEVVDLRPKQGCLWIYDPGKRLANRMEGLRSVGLKIGYDLHKRRGLSGWWTK